MLEKFKQHNKEKKLFSQDQRIMLAVSGGVDSMVMLKLFEMSGLAYGIAHVNFHLRGPESDGDALFVENVANSIRVPFFKKDFNTENYANIHRLSIQEAARNLRYEWFEELIHETEYDLYATAHHFDDQIETFFINLLRGTGVAGLRGIQARNRNCVRPLLFASRNEIEEFARYHRLKYREDSSNRSDSYLRNRIRRNILPALEKVDSGFRSGFAGTFENLSTAEKFIGSQVDSIRSRLIKTADEKIIIRKKELDSIGVDEFLLWELLRQFNFNRTNVQDIQKSLKGTPGKIFSSETHVLLVDREELIIRSVDVPVQQEKSVIIPEGQKSISLPVALIFEILSRDPHFKIDTDPQTAQLDHDKLEFPLIIRQPRQGDYFYPLGLGGKKLLSDFFTDQKLSAIEKENVWLLTSGGKIVWIIGRRIDDRFRITTKTKTVFSIRIL